MSETSPREAWQTALAEFFEQENHAQRLPAREQLSPAEEFQCQTVGGSLLDWLERHGPRFLEERERLRESIGVESEPAIVFTSHAPGLMAARQLFEPRPPFAFYFAPERFASFLTAHPDAAFRWHVVYSSHFLDELEPALAARAGARYKLQPSERFWIHRESSLMAPLFGCGGDHLWKWDGAEATLLEEGFANWVA